jgi:predicted dehydrogenase
VPPPGVEWDVFLGPAPLRPFNELRFKYNWHWFWDTGNGDIGNNGVHQMDVARWGLGVGAPRRISSTGGKYVYDDDQETPNTQIATFDYGDKELTLEVRGLPTGGEAGMTSPWGNLSATVFYGADGYMTLDDDGYRIYRGEKLELSVEQKGGADSTGLHIGNFLDAVRQRRPEMLSAGINEGALSTNLCHFANISYRVGRMLDFDAATGQLRGDDQANALLTRAYRSPYIVPYRV